MIAYTDNPDARGNYVTVKADTTTGRRSRAGAITAAARAYAREHGVKLTLVSKSYDEANGFLSRSAFRYRITRLPEAMEFYHVIKVRAGTFTDAPDNVYAPELYINTDEDGQISDTDDEDYASDARGQGWELMTGYTGQYGYHGFIMHPSELISPAMVTDILSQDGLYVVIAVETTDSADDPAGWAIAYRLSGEEV